NAAAHVRDAYLAYARTTLPAPVSGFVAKRAVQLGQRVSPGASLMAIVPLDQVWVDANFKEPQLASMRVGQPVTLHADIYGGKVVYHGTIAGFGAGTGSAFALLPAQNATGNWIKIVQRVPVRIGLDPQELAAHPLQIGCRRLVNRHRRSRPTSFIRSENWPTRGSRRSSPPTSVARRCPRPILRGRPPHPKRPVRALLPAVPIRRRR